MYNSFEMDPAVIVERDMIQKRKPITEAMVKGDSDIQKFYNGTTILITGGTGFLGKLLVEKLLRSCQIKKIYIILRPKKEKTVQQRLSDMIKDQVFDVLGTEHPTFRQKIDGVEGDLTQAGLGISNENLKIVIEEVNVIFHLAATINFDEALKTAIMTNVCGTREIVKVSKQCKNLRALIHVSTAYSHATQTKIGGEVFEDFYPMPVTPGAMMQLAETMEESRLQEITPQLIKGWPNTYAFTKALAEETVRTTARELPVCVVRPSIVICTFKEPLPGWIDMSSVFGPSGLVLAATMGVMHVVVANKDIKVDFTPADYVINAMIAAGWETGTTETEASKEAKIYTVSSSRNFLYWGDMYNILNNEARSILSAKALWYCFAFHITKDPFIWIATCLLHYIPGYLIDTYLNMIGKKPRLMKIYTNLYKLSGVFKYYSMNEWLFHDKNLKGLQMKMSDVDKIIYNFDVEDINWREMILIWVIGLRKYVVKDGLKDTQIAMKKQMILKVVTFVLPFLFLFIIWKLFRFIYSILFV